eukprot:FR740879.1.p1 GENE.FR740879.1~~FR740879.1.p1  ORF type:complete len:108 (+),score=15.45 FR740879.1:945-1268(+)
MKINSQFNWLVGSPGPVFLSEKNLFRPSSPNPGNPPHRRTRKKGGILGFMGWRLSSLFSPPHFIWNLPFAVLGVALFCWVSAREQGWDNSSPLFSLLYRGGGGVLIY